MKNIFDDAVDFIGLDNRRLRPVHRTTSESLTKRFAVQMPIELIENKSILDLGSCLGAAGHYALTNSSTSHYTGVEVSNYYYNTSVDLFKKYWKPDRYKIIHDDIEHFLDVCIEQNIQYDYVLACGILYGFLDIFSITKKLSKITKSTLIIENFNVPVENSDLNVGIIVINKKNVMIKGVSSDKHELFEGMSSYVSLNALDMILSNQYFERKEDILLPEKIEGTDDPYNEKYIFKNGATGPLRYIVRYYKTDTNVKTIDEIIISDDTSN